MNSVTGYSFDLQDGEDLEGQVHRIWRAIFESKGYVCGRTLRGQEIARSVAFSRDGRQVVSGSADATLRRWDAETGRPMGEPLSGHKSSVQSVAYSPDGRYIASGSLDATLRLWDAKTGQPIGRPFKGHTGGVLSVAFSPDGERIVSGGEDSALRLWDAATGTLIGKPWVGHSKGISSVAFSPDGLHVVSASLDKSLRRWNVSTGEPSELSEDPWTGHERPVLALAFSPDGRYVVSGSEDNTLRLWSAETGQPIGEPWRGHGSDVHSVAFSPDGLRVVSAGLDKTVRIWDPKSGAPIGEPLRGSGAGLRSVAYSPDGRFIVAGRLNDGLSLWDAESGDCVWNALSGHKEGISSVAYSPDGRRIASASNDKTLLLWDLETGLPMGEPLTGHDRGVCSVAYSPDGLHLVSGSEDSTLRQWDAETCKPVGEPLCGHEGPVLSVVYSPDGRHIASASEDRTVRRWDADSGKPVGLPMQGHEKSVVALAWSPDGRCIVSASEDRTLRLWSAATGLPIPIDFKQHDLGITTVAFSPDGRRVVSGTRDGTLQVWEVETGQPFLTPKSKGKPAKPFKVRHTDGKKPVAVSAVAYSPDGQRILSAGGGAVCMWGAGTAEPLVRPLSGLQDKISSLAYSPDGRRFASGSSDRTIRLWDALAEAPVTTDAVSQPIKEAIARAIFPGPPERPRFLSDGLWQYVAQRIEENWSSERLQKVDMVAARDDRGNAVSDSQKLERGILIGSDVDESEENEPSHDGSTAGPGAAATPSESAQVSADQDASAPDSKDDTSNENDAIASDAEVSADQHVSTPDSQDDTSSEQDGIASEREINAEDGTAQVSTVSRGYRFIGAAYELLCIYFDIGAGRLQQGANYQVGAWNAWTGRETNSRVAFAELLGYVQSAIERRERDKFKGFDGDIEKVEAESPEESDLWRFTSSIEYPEHRRIASLSQLSALVEIVSSKLFDLINKRRMAKLIADLDEQNFNIGGFQLRQARSFSRRQGQSLIEISVMAPEESGQVVLAEDASQPWLIAFWVLSTMQPGRTERALELLVRAAPATGALAGELKRLPGCQWIELAQPPACVVMPTIGMEPRPKVRNLDQALLVQPVQAALRCASVGPADRSDISLGSEIRNHPQTLRFDARTPDLVERVLAAVNEDTEAWGFTQTMLAQMLMDAAMYGVYAPVRIDYGDEADWAQLPVSGAELSAMKSDNPDRLLILSSWVARTLPSLLVKDIEESLALGSGLKKLFNGRLLLPKRIPEQLVRMGPLATDVVDIRLETDGLMRRLDHLLRSLECFDEATHAESLQEAAERLEPALKRVLQGEPNADDRAALEAPLPWLLRQQERKQDPRRIHGWAGIESAVRVLLKPVPEVEPSIELWSTPEAQVLNWSKTLLSNWLSIVPANEWKRQTVVSLVDRLSIALRAMTSQQMPAEVVESVLCDVRDSVSGPDSPRPATTVGQQLRALLVAAQEGTDYLGNGQVGETMLAIWARGVADRLKLAPGSVARSTYFADRARDEYLKELFCRNEVSPSVWDDLWAVLSARLRFDVDVGKAEDAGNPTYRIKSEQDPSSQYLYAAIRLHRHASWPNLRWLTGRANPSDAPDRVLQLASLLPPGAVLEALDHALRARSGQGRLAPEQSADAEAAERLSRSLRACLDQGGGAVGGSTPGSTYKVPSSDVVRLYRSLRPELTSHFEERRLSLSETDREQLVALMTLAAQREWESSRKQLRKDYDSQFEKLVMRPANLRFMGLETDYVDIGW